MEKNITPPEISGVLKEQNEHRSAKRNAWLGLACGILAFPCGLFFLAPLAIFLGIRAYRNPNLTGSSKHYESAYAAETGAKWAIGLGIFGTLVLIIALISLGASFSTKPQPTAPPYSSQLITDEFDFSTVGDSHGISYAEAVSGNGAVFSRKDESRIQYPFARGFPREGTLEWWIRVDSGYKYSDYKLLENLNEALIFTTDIAGGDVTWPGSAWLWVKSNGDVSLNMATEKYQPPKVLKAQRTKFRFGTWHSIGISFWKPRSVHHD